MPYPDTRSRTGRLGEEIAARFLQGRGATIFARNLRLPEGEIDLLVTLDGARVAVEVRTVTGPGPASAAFGVGKADRVWRLARRVGASRVDLVGVRLHRAGAEVHWIRQIG